MAEFTLHCFAQSGNAYKAALLLELAGADWEPVFVDFFKGGVRDPEFLELNEMGEVPVLEHRDTRLSQSGVILDYLGGLVGSFAPRSAVERREVLRWTFWDNHKLTSYHATWRFLVNFAPKGAVSDDVIAFLEGRARAAMKTLERHLKGRDWIASDQMTTADLSCAGYMFYEDEFPYDWAAEWPSVTAWKERIRALPGWKHPYELMPGHPIGQ